MKINLIIIFLVLFSLLSDSTDLKCTNISSDIFETLKPLSNKGPVTRCYNLELVIKEMAPDGYKRPVWTVNNQYPGPIIQANYGDRLLINVSNKLGEPSTIHWHGIFQTGTNFYDGVPGLTQCPIPNNGHFLYNFTVKQYGTFWYHSHFEGQIVDGLKGPLIIHNPKDPYLKEYDFEYVITLSDWYHMPAGDIHPILLSPSYLGGDPIPNSGEISGIGQFNCSDSTKKSCNPNNGVATYSVKKGKKYRFRIICTSAAAHFIFSIDEHPLTIIEVDGHLIEPVTLKTIPIHTAQRYSVILNANNSIKNYHIRAKFTVCTPIDNNQTINYNSSVNYNVVGILKYEGTKAKTPISKPYPLKTSDECRDVNPNILKPYKLKPPQCVTHKISLMVAFGKLATTGTIAFINNSSFVPNNYYPSNRKIINGINLHKFSQYENAYGYDRYFTNANDCKDAAVDIYITVNTSRSHPFHLHGHSFFVVYNGENQTGLEPPHPSSFNLIAPAFRDTVTVLGNSTTVIRYYIDNPGVWFMHCHMHWHLIKGMAVQFIELPSIIMNMTIPQDVFEYCAS